MPDDRGRGRGWWLACMLFVAGGVGADCPPPFEDAGQATFYTSAGFNTCTLPEDDGLFVALSEAQWDGSSHCGECLEVQGPLGQVLVRVVERCIGCAPGNLDLSADAFDAIANPGDGIAPVVWRRVECPVDGPLRFRFQGSNPFYLKIQASNHRYGVAGMAYFDGDTAVAMERTADNHFQAVGVRNISDVRVQVTATTGEAIEAELGDPGQAGLIDGPAQFAFCSEALFSDGFEPDPDSN